MLSPLLSAILLAAPAAGPADLEPRSVTVMVTDDKGAPIQSLSPEEVAVVENGTTRTLQRLEKDRRPLKLALLVDTSEPMGAFYRLQIVDPILRFLAKLPEGSTFAVWTTGDRPNKVVDFGQSPTDAAKALRRVYPTGGNTVFDAIVEASKELKQEEAGRTTLVIVTGTGIGFANYSKEQVVEEGKKSGALVLAAEIEETRASNAGGAGEVPASDYDYVLANLAEATGGRREVLLSAMGTGKTLDSFSGELASVYRLTYETVPGLKTRKVEVKVARPGARVRVGVARP
jgi:VWFA-related protein